MEENQRAHWWLTIGLAIGIVVTGAVTLTVRWLTT
jgi:hypothetical protein